MKALLPAAASAILIAVPAHAQDEFDGFYAGATATTLVKGVQAAGVIWTLRDLADYRVIERPALRFKLKDNRELISAPPPSAGGIALAQSLAMLQQLPWREAEPVQRAFERGGQAWLAAAGPLGVVCTPCLPETPPA